MEDVHHGMLGEVVDVDTATVNTLFIVEREGEELLVPAQEEFIRGIDQQQKLITVELPEGLLNGGGRISNQNKVKVLKRNRL